MWLEPDDFRAACSSESAVRQFVQSLRKKGVNEVIVQGKDATGKPIVGAAADSQDQIRWNRGALAATTAGIRWSLGWPVFLGLPKPGEEIVEYIQNPETKAARISIYNPQAAAGIPYLNPSIRGVRNHELLILRQLSTIGVKNIYLTNLGYPSIRGDFSDTAHEAFENHLGHHIPTWPDDLITFQVGEGPNPQFNPVRGLDWPSWLWWRADLLRQFVFDADAGIGEAAAARKVARPTVWLVVNGYYPLHFQEGLNWADPNAELGLIVPDAPPNYGATGVGRMADGLVLDMAVPIASRDQAVEDGLVWWSSVEGARDVATRVLPTDKPRRTMLHLITFAGEDGRLDEAERARLRAAINVARTAGNGVIISDWKIAEELQAWPELAPPTATSAGKP